MVVGSKPGLIVFPHKFIEGRIGLPLLHHEHLLHAAVGSCCKFHLPIHKFAIQIVPVLDGAAGAYELRQLGKLLAVAGGSSLGDELSGVKVLFNRQEYLGRVYRLDKVVRYLASDSLIHDIFLFALGNHYHRHMWSRLLYEHQCLKAGKAGHVLVKNNQVERMLPDKLKRVAAIIDSGYIITLAF